MPTTKFDIEDPYTYLTGLNNHHESEAIPGGNPRNHSLPQSHELGLYNERISGSSFVARKANNKQTFLYRILPSTSQTAWEHIENHALNHDNAKDLQFLPDQYLWMPFDIDEACNFLEGLRMIGGAGDPNNRNGVAYYSYSCGRDMSEHESFYSADGDWLIAAQTGALDIQTEMGMIRLRPCEICVIPRGIRFRVALVQPQTPVRGHMIECYSGHFDVPEKGIMGTLGMANVRDFEIPTAKFVDHDEITQVWAKFGGKMHRAQLKGSTYNAVAWQGTYFPFKYDLGKFMPIGSILYDHHDPSVYTVLTCPSDKPEYPACDFLVMARRWNVMENTFQLPYFHRNTMSEFSVAVTGGIDTVQMPDAMMGMSILHNSVSAHGLTAEETAHAQTKKIEPERIPDNVVSFLVESCFPIGLTKWASSRAIPTNKSKKFGKFPNHYRAIAKGRSKI